MVVLVFGLVACDGDGDGADGAPVIDAPPAVIDASQISACSDIHAEGLTSATIDALVAEYNGLPCTSPLEGGIASLQHECGYGAYLFVCGQSSGLHQFGCMCADDHLFCSNGEEIKRQQELLCGDGGGGG